MEGSSNLKREAAEYMIRFSDVQKSRRVNKYKWFIFLGSLITSYMLFTRIGWCSYKETAIYTFLIVSAMCLITYVFDRLKYTVFKRSMFIKLYSAVTFCLYTRHKKFYDITLSPAVFCSLLCTFSNKYTVDDIENLISIKEITVNNRLRRGFRDGYTMDNEL